MLFTTYQVNDAQQQALQELSAACQQADHGLPTAYHHLLKQKRDSENNVFYYQDEQLIGFLSVYFFYEDACEITLMVSPEWRRKGIANLLLQTIMPLLERKHMKNLIFSIAGEANQEWLPKLGFTYRQSEYHMERQRFEPVLINRGTLTLRKASMQDVALLCAIDTVAFTGQQSMPERFFGILNDSEYTLFMAYQGEQVVGKAHIRWQADSSLLSDIAILPSFQRKGLGGELLSHCINHSIMQGKVKVTLDVEATNKNALRLYIRHGFKTTKVFDYWVTPLVELKKIMQLKKLPALD